MIIVLAGTREGREICARLQGAGRPVLASVTSSWGESLLKSQGVANVLQGNLSRAGLEELIRSERASLIIDATHPFAATISQDAMDAARQIGIEYLRLEREPAALPDHPLIIRIQALGEIEAYLEIGHRLFSTLGSKHLPAILPMVRRKKAQLVARVLPHSAVLKSCEDLGLLPGQLIAMQGPFSLALNVEMFRHYGADLVISKESGAYGGLETKAGAALELGIPILVWSRPKLDYPRCFSSCHELLAYINDEERDRR